MDEDKLREKYIEMQVLDKQIKQVQEQIMQLDEQMADLGGVLVNLEDLKSVEEGSEILVPVSNGIFIKAEVKSIEKVGVNVGSDTVVMKTIEESQQLLTSQNMEIQDVQQKMVDALQDLMAQARRIETQAQQMISEYDKDNSQ